MLVGIAVLVAAILAGAASAATQCTYEMAGCEAQFQQLLANDLPADGSTYTGVNGLVQGGDGAAIEDFYAAMIDAGVAEPEVGGIGGYLDGEGLTNFGEGFDALDLGAESFAPETLGVSVVGAVAVQYGVSLLWATFNPPVGADMGTPYWQQVAGSNDVSEGVCYGAGPGGGYVPGWGGGTELANAGGAYYMLSWPGQNQQWQYDFNSRGSCGLPDPNQVSAGTYTDQEMADLRAYYAAATADASETGCPGDAPTFLTTQTIGGVDWKVLVMTQAQYTGEVACQIQELTPYPSSPTHTTTVTAPAPAYVDFNLPRADVGLDTGLGAYIDQQLVTGGATIPDPVPTTPTFGDQGGWQYDPTTERVTYGPFTIPNGDDQARIYCDDAGSGTAWSNVTAGSVVTLSRGGIQTTGGNGSFDCYLDDRTPAESTVSDPVQTEDPTVTPNPVEFEDGTPLEVGPPPSGGGSCNCTFDFGPLQHLDFGSVFPFGIPGYLAGILGAMEVPGAAPSFDISVGHTYHVSLASSSWQTTYRPLVWPVMEFVIAVGAIVFIALRHWRRGTADV